MACPYPYRMRLKVQNFFLVACWTNVLKPESDLKTSMPRSLPKLSQSS